MKFVLVGKLLKYFARIFKGILVWTCNVVNYISCLKKCFVSVPGKIQFAVPSGNTGLLSPNQVGFTVSSTLIAL
jgi:hypothetical protein